MKPWLLALISGRQRQLRAYTFTSNTAFTVPVTVSSLLRLTGKGADGTAASWAMDTHTVMSCTRTSTNQVGGVTTSKLDAVLDGADKSGAFGFGGTGIRTVNYQLVNYFVGPDNLTRRGTPVSQSKTVRGQETTDVGSTAGNITHTPNSTTYVRVNVDTRTSGTTGANTTAFGRTFTGGVEVPAVAVSLDNVAVTPGATYNLIVPAGGSVTFTYYE